MTGQNKATVVPVKTRTLPILFSHKNWDTNRVRQSCSNGVNPTPRLKVYRMGKFSPSQQVSLQLADISSLPDDHSTVSEASALCFLRQKDIMDRWPTSF